MIIPNDNQFIVYMLVYVKNENHNGTAYNKDCFEIQNISIYARVITFQSTILDHCNN